MNTLIRIVTIFALAGCAWLKVYDEPRIVPLEVEVRRLTWQEAELALRLQVNNPNKFGVKLTSFDCQVFVEGEPSLFRVEPPEYEFPPKSEMVVEIPVFVPYSSLFKAVHTAFTRDKLHYKVMGTAAIGVLKFPFDFSGEYSLPGKERLPAAEAAPESNSAQSGK